MIIVFDLDEVLYDEKTFVLSGFSEVSKYLDKNNIIPFKQSMDFLTKRFKIQRNYIFDELLKRFEVHNKKNIKKCISVYRSHKPLIKIYPEALKCLNKLKNYPIYIVTDGNKIVQKNKIDALKIKKMIKFCFLTSNYKLKNAKPSPYCFMKICNLENAKPKDVIYVGDNPNKDFVGIKPLGFKTVRVLKGRYKNLKKAKKYEANIQINSLREFDQKLITNIIKF